jgi:hypothetical protein
MTARTPRHVVGDLQSIVLARFAKISVQVDF